MPKYQAHEKPPLHPVTGAPALYYFVVEFGTDAGKRIPRWGRKPKDPLTKDPAGTWYSTPEVARITGKSRQWVTAQIAAGRLKGTRAPALNGTGPSRWFINGSDIIRFVEGKPALAAHAVGLAK